MYPNSYYTTYSSAYLTRPYSVTSELWTIFNKYSSDLRTEKNHVEESIRCWYQNMYDEIKKHFDNQMTAVHKHFSELQTKIDTIRGEYSKSAQEWTYSNDERSINALLEQCKILKFTMGRTSFIDRKFSFVEYLPVETMANEPKQLSNESDTKMVQLTTNSTINDRLTSENQIERGINSAAGNRTSTINLEVHYDNASQKSISTASNSLPIDSQDAKSIGLNDQTLYECCRICYMLFPKSLSERDRENHRLAHYQL